MKIEQLALDSECIKIFDPVKKEVIATYPNYTKAERGTGITCKMLKIAARTKTRRFSPILNKEVAIRVAAKK